MKKNVAPSLTTALYRALSALISVDRDASLDLVPRYCTVLYCTVLYCTVLDVVPRCGLQVEDVTRLALEGCLRAEQGPSLVTVRRLFRSLGFLLGYNANVDDKHRSQMQDVVRSAAS